jgi:hypothetical protein
VGRAADVLASTVGGFIDDLTATPVPSALPPALADTPVIAKPDEPYTNQPMVDLVGTVPEAATGQPDNRIRIYVAVGEQEPGVVTEIPVGATTHFVVPGVALVEGTNAFSASIVSNAGESEKSPVVTYVFDATIPRIVVSSPKDGAVVNARTASIVGETQSRSEVRVFNVTANISVNSAADESGKFTIEVPIVAGENDVRLTVIDPAGNVNHLGLSLLKGSGKLLASVSASPRQIKISTLPQSVTLVVSVADPDGMPLQGANVTFSLAAPGVQAVTSGTIKTGGDGTASWTTTIPKGATKGSVSATVIVQTTQYGETTDQTVMNLTK